jgi:hypothetical protein
MNNELNDSLDDLLGDPSANVPREATNSNYKPLVQQFEEQCQVCRGTGNFRSYSGRIVGQCFKCKGAGKKTFKSSPEARAANRQQAATRKANRQQELVNEFAIAHPAVFAWINESAASFSFAASMLESLNKFGGLTDGQMAACVRCIDKREAAKVAAAQRIENAPVANQAGIDRLKLAFDTAIAYSAEKGLKRSPKITISCMVIAPAKATSANPGALYVTEDNQYLGKIKDGKFYASRDCSAGQTANVLKFVEDPKAASEVYGRETGTCCVCNATLTSEWRFRGIGPICAEKFGW